MRFRIEHLLYSIRTLNSRLKPFSNSILLKYLNLIPKYLNTCLRHIQTPNTYFEIFVHHNNHNICFFFFQKGKLSLWKLHLMFHIWVSFYRENALWWLIWYFSKWNQMSNVCNFFSYPVKTAGSAALTALFSCVSKILKY